MHALVYLGHTKKVLNSEELAQNVCTNPVLIRKVMSRLKKAGIVNTKGGNNGGYFLTADTETLTLREIAEAIDAHFVGSPWKSGDMNKACLISSGMGSLMEELCARLDGLCRESLRDMTVADIDRKLLSRKKGPCPAGAEE